MDQFISVLRQHDLRVTNARQLIFSALNKSHKPLMIRDIHLASPSIDRTSIYRNLETLVEIGVVQVVPRGWKQSYELAEPFAPHHHHLQCTDCKDIVALDIDELEQQIQTIADQYGYTLTDHHIELIGLCQNCKIKSL